MLGKVQNIDIERAKTRIACFMIGIESLEKANTANAGSNLHLRVPVTLHLSCSAPLSLALSSRSVLQADPLGLGDVVG